MLPDQLVEEVKELLGDGYEVELVEDSGWACIIIHCYSLPAGFNKKETTLLLKCPLSYPNGQPDMFWTDTDLTLSSGQPAASAEVVERIMGKDWRRFSWHPQKWNPGIDNLRTYLEFVNNRLAKQS